MVSLTFDILAVQIVLGLEKGRLVQVWGNMFTLICLILCFGKRIVFQTLVSVTSKLNLERLLFSKNFPKTGSALQVFTRSHLQPFCVGGVASQLSHYYRR